MELDQVYEVDAILIIGENTDFRHLSEFNIYIGMSTDHLSNTKCPGGPFAYPLDERYGFYTPTHATRNAGTEWTNGGEIWCNLVGRYVSFVREPNAQPPLDEIVLCSFGILSERAITYDEIIFISEINAEVLSQILEENIPPPYLLPTPQSPMEIDAGAALDLFIGQPTSDLHNEVRVDVNVGNALFIHFNESSLFLTVPQNVTTNQEEGIYSIEIYLTDTVFEVSSTTIIQLQILPVDEVILQGELEETEQETQESQD